MVGFHLGFRVQIQKVMVGMGPDPVGEAHELLGRHVLTNVSILSHPRVVLRQFQVPVVVLSLGTSGKAEKLSTLFLLSCSDGIGIF